MDLFGVLITIKINIYTHEIIYSYITEERQYFCSNAQRGKLRPIQNGTLSWFHHWEKLGYGGIFVRNS